jgi:hypothetical protein
LVMRMACEFLLGCVCVCVRRIERVLRKEESQERIGVPDSTREGRPGSDPLVITFRNLFPGVMGEKPHFSG